VHLDAVEHLVLDEADRMLDMGFIHDIKRIQKLLPRDKQTLLFSATFSPEIRQLAKTMLRDPVEIDVAPRNTTVETVRQRIHPVDKSRKTALLTHLVNDNGWHQVLVFSRTKHGANKLVKQLAKADIRAAAIHGNKSQAQRTRALADFKKGKVRVLVATDIAARGLDIEQLPHVVNFELPNVPEDYVHRIGRTGRAGLDGEAVSLVCIDEKKLLADIEKLLKRDIEQVVIPGYEPDKSIKAEPIKNGRNKQSFRGRRNRTQHKGRSRNAPAQARRNRGQGNRSRRAA
jgi:ATP-dependent RNA helicase RhlE